MTRRVKAVVLFSLAALGYSLSLFLVARSILLLNRLRLTAWRDGFVLACVGLSFVFTSVLNQELAGNAVENFAEAHSFVTIGSLLLAAALLKLKFSPVVTEKRRER